MTLPRSFYTRPVDVVAHSLIGVHVRLDDVVLRITEVEAYGDDTDSASHCRMGRTKRNAPMWGPVGRAYVYLCYGIHQMLNIVGNDGSGGAVLVRACEPVEGAAIVAARRGGRTRPDSLAGPGKVGAALAIDTSWSGHDLGAEGGLQLLAGRAPDRLAAGPRVGIDFASAADKARPWRFADADSRWVSHRATLRDIGRP